MLFMWLQNNILKISMKLANMFVPQAMLILQSILKLKITK